MQAAGNFGAITLRDSSVKAKVQLLPFDGDAYGVFAFVESIVLLNGSQSSERLSLTQRLMINPVVRSAAAELVAAQDVAIARYTAESASDMLEPEQRCASSKKAAHHRDLQGALSRVSEAPENCILVAGGLPAAAELPVPGRPRRHGAAHPAYAPRAPCSNAIFACCHF